MYGLKQVGLLANQRLTKLLATAGYIPTAHMPSLWTHQTRDIKFSLVVDNSGIKYIHKHDADHLLATRRTMYIVSTNWTGSLYCRLIIAWNYAERYVVISMPGYIEAALHKFNHPLPNKSKDAPHIWNWPTYGATVQYPTPTDTSEKLQQPDVTRVQKVVGNLLYYSIAINPTVLALSTIASTQAKATQDTAKTVVHLLNFNSSKESIP